MTPHDVRRTQVEQETTMTWDSAEKLVRVFSARAADQGRLKRMGIKPYKGAKNKGFFYILPLSMFHWGLKRVSKGAGRAFQSYNSSRSRRVSDLKPPFLTQKPVGGS